MRKRNHTKRIALGVAALSMLFAGSAFTASNTFASGATAPRTGYASTTVTGATVNSLVYNLNAAGDNVDTVTLALANDTTGSAVSIGFNDGATTSCGTGTLDSTTTPTKTTYTCKNGASNFVQSTSGLTKTAVVVN